MRDPSDHGEAWKALGQEENDNIKAREGLSSLISKARCRQRKSKFEVNKRVHALTKPVRPPAPSISSTESKEPLNIQATRKAWRRDDKVEICFLLSYVLHKMKDKAVI